MRKRCGKTSSLSETMSLTRGTASSRCPGAAERGGKVTWLGLGNGTAVTGGHLQVELSNLRR
jgi:hypothetical protein